MTRVKLGLKSKVYKYVKDWEGRGYDAGIPDEAPKILESLGKVPSYRRICIALLKGDIALQSLGFVQPKSMVYSEIKREEIRKRGIETDVNQLRLFE